MHWNLVRTPMHMTDHGGENDHHWFGQSGVRNCIWHEVATQSASPFFRTIVKPFSIMHTESPSLKIQHPYNLFGGATRTDCDSGRIFTATSSCVSLQRALYTTPQDPRPSSSRIWYLFLGSAASSSRSCLETTPPCMVPLDALRNSLVYVSSLTTRRDPGPSVTTVTWVRDRLLKSNCGFVSSVPPSTSLPQQLSCGCLGD